MWYHVFLVNDRRLQMQPDISVDRCHEVSILILSQMLQPAYDFTITIYQAYIWHMSVSKCVCRYSQQSNFLWKSSKQPLEFYSITSKLYRFMASFDPVTSAWSYSDRYIQIKKLVLFKYSKNLSELQLSFYTQIWTEELWLNKQRNTTI